MATGFVLVFALIVLPFIQYQAKAAAEEERIIRIYQSSEPQYSTPRIEPDEVWIKPGTAVVWANWGKSEISINFPKGKECEDAIYKTLGWEYKSDRGCLITNQYIPFGGTASMTFEKPGRYEYEVEFTNTKMVKKGFIRVRNP
jgi:plastocyanin